MQTFQAFLEVKQDWFRWQTRLLRNTCTNSHQLTWVDNLLHKLQTSSWTKGILIRRANRMPTLASMAFQRLLIYNFSYLLGDNQEIQSVQEIKILVLWLFSQSIGFRNHQGKLIALMTLSCVKVIIKAFLKPNKSTNITKIKWKTFEVNQAKIDFYRKS